MRIAIDGPAGAGKTTTAKQVAKELGIPYYDTGALYRVFALYCKNNGIEFSDKAPFDDIFQNMDIVQDNGIRLNGVDVSNEIGTEEISQMASQWSTLQEVRDGLLAIQKQAAKHSVVMEGRDIGSVIIPDAELKIFMTADVHDRAARRMMDLNRKGKETNYHTVLDDIKERDLRDTTRKVAPLRKVEGAYYIDNSMLSFEQTVAIIVGLAKKMSAETRD